ncbi:MAG: toll/interleukin-1 receptor domain-containing protein [Chloroflexota bacterium]|nr:toll/interleukin-1 receptor domain-containing protein [Chloroflexota bacterium]
MKVFLSHNKADKEFARSLATALSALGVSVWFDEWEIEPGTSIAGGIEHGLAESDTFVLVWSETANASKWVGAERAAFLKRMIQEKNLRIIPVMLDDTALPALVADYKGFCVEKDEDVLTLAAAMVGDGGATPEDVELAGVLQRRLLALAKEAMEAGDPFGILACPRCGSESLKHSSATHDERDFYVIACEDCEWCDVSEA